jgi:transcriptional regulator with XRE-family HTH domain
MAKNSTPDPIMRRAQKLFEASGKSLEQLGQDMGYTGETARQSAWQFLNKTADPRLSMLKRFAKAVGVSLSELTDEGKQKR